MREALAHVDDFTGFNHMGGWFNVASGMGIVMLLFWVLVIVGVILIVKRLSDQSNDQGRETKALDIINERYAKGEIDKEEFETKKKDLIS